MKPSERIKEITDKMFERNENKFFIDIDTYYKAILQYLDEEYEYRKKRRLEAGAKDFAERFEGVMKEMSEE